MSFGYSACRLPGPDEDDPAVAVSAERGVLGSHRTRANVDFDAVDRVRFDQVEGIARFSGLSVDNDAQQAVAELCQLNRPWRGAGTRRYRVAPPRARAARRGSCDLSSVELPVG